MTGKVTMDQFDRELIKNFSSKIGIMKRLQYIDLYGVK